MEVERTPRTVTIYGIDAFEGANGEWMLSIHCSRGTYIRTLCADIGKKLGCGGCMGSLRRTAVGNFRLENSLTLEELRNTDRGSVEQKLIPLSDVFANYPAVTLPAFQGKLYANGEKRATGSGSFFLLLKACIPSQTSSGRTKD